MGNVQRCSQKMESNHICFTKVRIFAESCRQARQVMQGDTNDKSNFIQLLKLRGKGQPVIFF